MKNIFKLNLSFIGLPFFLCLLGFIDQSFILYGLLSTMLTGLVQVIIGLKMLIDEPKNKYLQGYVTGVLLFFLNWFIAIKMGHHDIADYCLFSIPPALAIYLSVIIYKKI